MNKERVREPMAAPPDEDYLRQKAADGWSFAAVEWERPIEIELTEAGRLKEEIPFGLRVSSDCKHLEEDPDEKEALMVMLEMIVEDRSLSEVAEALNNQGLQTRQGTSWTQSSVFYMLPRLIETAPQIFSSETWRSRRGEVTTRLESLMK
jgi:hypothetical protein